jgi:phage tail-like protein
MSDLIEYSLSHRFLATFFFRGIPSPLDLRFQRVSGLSRELAVSAYREGGENAANRYFPENVQHGSLVLERGVMSVTPLTYVFDSVLGRGEAIYVDVVIMLLGNNMLPMTTWTASDALPVRWQVGDLDARNSAILINTFELRYRDMRLLGIRT